MFDALSSEGLIFPPLDIPVTNKNREIAASEINLPRLIRMIADWFRDRPQLVVADSGVYHIAKFIWSEFLEAEDEHQFEGVNHNVLYHAMEVLDALFVIASAVINNGLVPDYYQIYTRVSDIGRIFRGDSTYRNLAEIGGSIEPGNIERPVNYLLEEWILLSKNLPFIVVAEYYLMAILFKNGREEAGNYPSVYLGDENPYIKFAHLFEMEELFDSGKNLVPRLRSVELLAAHDHVTACLRYIRNVIKYIDFQDRPFGLLKEDHFHLAKYIADYQNPNALRQLKTVVSRSRGYDDWKEVDNLIAERKKMEKQNENGLLTVEYQVGKNGVIERVATNHTIKV